MKQKKHTHTHKNQKHKKIIKKTIIIIFLVAHRAITCRWWFVGFVFSFARSLRLTLFGRVRALIAVTSLYSTSTFTFFLFCFLFKEFLGLKKHTQTRVPTNERDPLVVVVVVNPHARLAVVLERALHVVKHFLVSPAHPRRCYHHHHPSCALCVYHTLTPSSSTTTKIKKKIKKQTK